MGEYLHSGLQLGANTTACRAKFVKCDTTSWNDQLALFAAAKSFSPTSKIHYVVANAGITKQDDVFAYNPSGPEKPDLKIIDVNIRGVLYTTKLANHYFISQNGEKESDKQEDTCLVLISSGAGYLDCPRAPQYQASKYGMRGVMHALRRTAHHYGSRVNIIAPW
jgi:NAD(P)-dependent dehydrogenase (short-subunit alcohol dehydrogenase family)